MSNTSYRNHMQEAVDLQQQALDQNRELTPEEQTKLGAALRKARA